MYLPQGSLCPCSSLKKRRRSSRSTECQVDNRGEIRTWQDTWNKEISSLVLLFPSRGGTHKWEPGPVESVRVCQVPTASSYMKHDTRRGWEGGIR